MGLHVIKLSRRSDTKYLIDKELRRDDGRTVRYSALIKTKCFISVFISQRLILTYKTFHFFLLSVRSAVLCTNKLQRDISVWLLLIAAADPKPDSDNNRQTIPAVCVSHVHTILFCRHNWQLLFLGYLSSTRQFWQRWVCLHKQIGTAEHNMSIQRVDRADLFIRGIRT